MDIQFFVLDILLATMFLAFCISCYKYKNSPLTLKIVAWYIFVEFITQAAVIAILQWYQNQNRFFLFHILIILEAITLLLMYREIFKKYIEEKEQYVYRKIFIIVIALFVVFAIVNTIYWQPITIFPSNTRVVLSAIIILLNILYIYKYTSHEPIPRTGLELVNYKMTRISLFWITTGLFLFHSFSLMRYMFINVLREELSKESYRNISIVYTIFAIILFLFVAIGFIKFKYIVIVDDRKTNSQTI